MAYHQPFIAIADSVTKSKAWSNSQVTLAGFLYAVSVIVVILVSSVYWKAMGLMPG
jgi:hypothetical protein